MASVLFPLLSDVRDSQPVKLRFGTQLAHGTTAPDADPILQYMLTSKSSNCNVHQHNLYIPLTTGAPSSRAGTVRWVTVARVSLVLGYPARVRVVPHHNHTTNTSILPYTHITQLTTSASNLLFSIREFSGTAPVIPRDVSTTQVAPERHYFGHLSPLNQNTAVLTELA